MKNTLKRIQYDEAGDAVVEATILFPIIIMIFFAFILLAMYLPTSVALQRSVQKAALIASAHRSDLGYTYEISNNSAGVNWEGFKQENVYTYMGRGFNKEIEIAEKIVKKYAADALYEGQDLRISVKEDINDKRYLIITAEQTLIMPFDFPFLPISNKIELKKSARVMNRDADEFIRNMDIVYDLVIKKTDKIKETLGDMSKFLDVFNEVKKLLEI